MVRRKWIRFSTCERWESRPRCASRNRCSRFGKVFKMDTRCIYCVLLQQLCRFTTSSRTIVLITTHSICRICMRLDIMNSTMTEQLSDSSGFDFLPYFLVIWVFLAGFIIHARLSLWFYSVLVAIGIAAYFFFEELTIFLSILLILVGLISAITHKVEQSERDAVTDSATNHGHKQATSNSARPPKNDGVLRIYDVDGKQQVRKKTKRQIHIGQQPPLNLSPQYWDISLLISKPGGITPDICFDICPPQWENCSRRC